MFRRHSRWQRKDTRGSWLVAVFGVLVGLSERFGLHFSASIVESFGRVREIAKNYVPTLSFLLSIQPKNQYQYILVHFTAFTVKQLLNVLPNMKQVLKDLLLYLEDLI